ncbi:MAG: hypothetical protein ABUL58_00515, partial [Steroidobacter sp.]
SLSSYAWIRPNTVADIAIGIGRHDQKFDVSLIAKNAFNDNTPLLATRNNYTPAVRRLYYLQFSGKL